MKTKTINTVIKKKVDEWIESIDNEALKSLAKNNVIVTGGCIPSMLLGEKVNDFDIYFRTKEAAVKIAEYYIAEYKRMHGEAINMRLSGAEDPDRLKIMIPDAGMEGKSKDDEEGLEELTTEEDKLTLKFFPVFFSANAITLSDKIQLIIRFYGEPEEIHENYDFVHCTNYWTSWENKVQLNTDALESILTKELRYVGSKYPLCSIIRLRKFIKRGWTINAGQILKMVMQVSELDLKNIITLEDQLTGVDALYFGMLINALKAKNEEQINSSYVVEIIDKVF